MSDKRLIKSTDSFNVYQSFNDFGIMVLSAYKNRKKIAEEKYCVPDPVAYNAAVEHFIWIAENKLRTRF